MNKEKLIDKLAGSCMGIGRTVECKKLAITNDMTTLLLRSLFMIDHDNDFDEKDFQHQLNCMMKLKNELIPSCSLCGHPCGVNDDPDIDQIRKSEDAEARFQLLDRCIKIGSSLGGAVNIDEPDQNAPLFVASEQIISFLFESLYLACSMQKAQNLV